MCLQHVLSESPKQKYQPKPLVFKNWPPTRNSAAIRSNGMMIHLRGSGSTNIGSRVPPPGPGMFIKSASPIRFGIPMRPNDRQKGSLQSSPSNHVFYQSGHPQAGYSQSGYSHAAAYKRPYAAHSAGSQNGFKFSSPSQKTAIKFQVSFQSNNHVKFK